MKKIIITLLLAALATTGYAVTRDFSVSWTQPCATIEGDDLDLDNDGICELLTGFRIYTDEGEFVTGLPEDGTRTHVFPYNTTYGTQCFVMTAYLEHEGVTHESPISNTGGCLDVVPGKPVAPVLQN